MKVTIVDTGVANSASMVSAFERLDARCELSRDPRVIDSASMLVLPGVGSFGSGMAMLRSNGLDRIIADRILADRPTLCVCLGLQLLARESEESPGVRGLGVIDAAVSAFPDEVRRPQFGWNLVEPVPGCVIRSRGYAYFANSYRITEVPDGWDGAMSEHGGRFVAALSRGNILACQFHPELSGAYGASILGAWMTNAMEATPC